MKGKFILFIIIIAVLAGLVGSWYWQRNRYSKDLLRLEILGPAQAQLLEEVEYTVKYKNNSNIGLEEAKIVFEYPEHSLTEAESLREEVALGDIYPGEEKSRRFSARLLGKKGEVKQAKATLAYKPKNLNASYESETTLTTVLEGNSPLNLEFDIPSKLESGKQLKFSLNYFSGLDYPLSDLRIKMEYPAGFEFTAAKPNGLDEKEWDVGALNRGEGGRIELSGNLSGQLGEEKLFRALLGLWMDNEFVQLQEAGRSVKIIKPLLSVFQRINGKEEYTALPGDWLHYEIFFRNVGEEPFRQLFLVSNLSGDGLDFSTLKVESGQFNKDEKSIIWDWRDVSRLQFLDRGEEGKVEFWVALKEPESGGFAQANGLIVNQVIVSEIKERFENKIGSQIELSGAAYFEDEVFGNTGPLPPQAGQETTYTVVWQAESCCNEVKNIRVKATLPPNVKMTGQVFPEDSRLTFDSDSREIIWEAGDLSASAPEPQSCAFQVSLTPTSVQRGKKATIIREARLSAEDQWTGQAVSAQASAIDTSLPDDETVGEGEGIVQ